MAPVVGGLLLDLLPNIVASCVMDRSLLTTTDRSRMRQTGFP
jgi:hypothetical protein